MLLECLPGNSWILGPQQGNRRGPCQRNCHSNHEASCHSKGIEEFFGKSFLHPEVHSGPSINHLSFHQITQERRKLQIGKGIANNLSKATVDHDNPPYGASPNLQKATVALFSLKPICHWCFYRPRRWRRYQTTSLLRESCSKGCGSALP